MPAGRMIVAATLWALCWCHPIAAQDSEHIGGAWFSIGVGGGATTSDEFTGSDHFGGAFYGRVGSSLGAQASLGAELLLWGRKQGDLSPARGNLALIMLFHPTPDGPFFLKGGAGVAIAALLRPSTGGVTTRGATGFGATGGLGADLRLAGNVFLTPNLDVMFQHYPEGTDPSLTNVLFLVTLGLTFR